MNLVAGARIGPYAILSPLGAGGMGEVYRGTDTRLDRTVAIKVLSRDVAADASSRQRFEREARAISSLSHPHICALYDVGEHDGIPFLVMEHLEGETLARRLFRGTLPMSQVLGFAIQIAGALEHAHRHGIVHRDLKPANIMLTRAGVKLLDFGVAKLCVPKGPDVQSSGTIHGRETVTEKGTAVGTLNYMAPEQLEGRDVDARTDLFAFGAVLYEMTTGQQAFEGRSVGSVMARILRDDVPAASMARREADAGGPVDGDTRGPPPLLDQIIARCLEKNPEDRWQTAIDLKQALKWIEQGVAPGVPAPTMSPPAGPRARLAWTTAALATAVAALTLVALVVQSRWRDIPEPAPVRFEIDPPEGANFGVSPAVMAISPDGRAIAFHANSSEGVIAIWVRPIDALAPRKLAGTDRGVQPFWSPDGRSIAFVADGRLKKIDLAGGAPQSLADAASGQSGAWGLSDGAPVIVFKPAAQGGLSRIAASGGQATPVTTLDQSRGEITHNWPQFLPDGRHFLYHVRSTQPKYDAVLYVGSLDGSPPVPIASTDSHATYVPPGVLLYLRSNTLVAHRFDATANRLIGEPIPIVENVDYNPTTRRGAFVASQTGVLVYRTLGETELVWLDRVGRPLDSLGSHDRYANPALSPNEQRLAVDRIDPESDSTDVWLIDLVRGVRSRFTFNPAADDTPVWSPDGARILFRSFRDGHWSFYQKPANGTGTEEAVLADLDEFATPLDWTPDARALLYERGHPGPRKSALWLLPLVGEHKPSLFIKSDFNVHHGRISPDGRWIAYVSQESGRNEVYLRPFPDGEGQWQISTTGGVEPQWRADGRELFYIAPDQSLMAVAVTPGPSMKAGAPMRLFPTRMLGFRGTSSRRNQFVVTDDGQRFLVSQAPEGAPTTPITVVVNWTGALKGQP